MANQSVGAVIAVVDDDHRILESLKSLLESAAHDVRLFRSGMALLESEHLAEIDCVISDIGMPGMNGLELIRAIDATRPGLPIIVITGHPEVLNKLRPIDGAQHRVFTKPFDGKALLIAVANALRDSDPRTTLA